jgi:hypothetical protein
MNKKYKYTTYLAGAIEAVSTKEMKTWRQELSDKLASPDLLIYDPVVQESFKVGKPSGEQVEYIKGLKQGGHWGKFKDEMQKIWWGTINPQADLIDLFKQMQLNASINGNTQEEMVNWGDYEAVARSSFIVVEYKKDIKTIGTIYEVMLAFLLRIPIYLILPDHAKTDCNSSLLYGVIISGGEVFYTTNECVKYIKEKYQLIEILKPEEEKKKE